MKKNRKRALYIGGGITLALLGLWWLSRRNALPQLTAQSLPQLPPPTPSPYPAFSASAPLAGVPDEPEGSIDIDGLTLDDGDML